MKKILISFGLIVVLISVFYWGKSNGDPNERMVYGKTGLPKNCRAIIHENYKGYLFEGYTAKESLESIYRNCGENGYSWDE